MIFECVCFLRSLQGAGLHSDMCNTILSDLKGNITSLLIWFAAHSVKDGEEGTGSVADKENGLKQCSDRQNAKQEG